MTGTYFNDSHVIFYSESSLLTKRRIEKIAEKISKEASGMILEQLNKNLKDIEDKKNKSDK